jgi:hypothetical protein
VSTLRQTLYPTGLAGFARYGSAPFSGTATKPTNATAAEMHDGLDTTFGRIRCAGSGVNAFSGMAGVPRMFDACSEDVGDIDFIRVVVRAKHEKTGTAGSKKDLLVGLSTYDGDLDEYSLAAIAAAQALTTDSFVTFNFDSTAYPTFEEVNDLVGSLAWAMDCIGNSDSTWDDCSVSEICVEVWGAPDPQSTVVSSSGAGTADVVLSASSGSVVSASGVGAGECGSVSVHFNPPTSSPLAVSLDGVTGLPLTVPQTLYKTGQRNLRSLGKPHFAFTNITALAESPFSGGEYGIGGTFMLHRLPTQLVSADEVHWLFSFHETSIGGDELLSLGITPSGKFAIASKVNGTTFSAGGAVPVDGLFHYVRFDLFSGSGWREVFLDGVCILSVVGPSTDDYPAPEGGSGVRLAIFNGRDGASMLDCSVATFEFGAEEGSIEWPIDEGHGSVISDSGLWDWSQDLEATWFDGSPIPACPEYPTLPLTSAYVWGHGTAWTTRAPIQPTYRKVVSP